MPASTPTPRSSSASATPSAPSSCQFTEAWSGSTAQERTSAARLAASGVVHAPVVTPMRTPGGTARRTAETAAATTPGAKES